MVPTARKMLDLVTLVATGVLCLVSAYWLVNDDFVFIYGACFVYAAVAAWRLSTTWLKNASVSLSALLFALATAEAVLHFAEPGELESERSAARYTKGYSQPLRVITSKTQDPAG